MNRVRNGLKLYQESKVNVAHMDEELSIFTVEGSRSDEYQVSMYDNSILCDCDDYQYRHAGEPGSYLCKHCFGAMFKLAELYGFTEKLKQTTLK